MNGKIIDERSLTFSRLKYPTFLFMFYYIDIINNGRVVSDNFGKLVINLYVLGISVNSNGVEFQGWYQLFFTFPGD